MNNHHSETLSAFCDGEAVDPRLLGEALEHPEARALLVEFARLREALREDDGPLPASLASRGAPARVLARVPLPAAVALVTLAVLASLVLPWRADDEAPPPPTPTQTLQFEPGVDWHTP